MVFGKLGSAISSVFTGKRRLDDDALEQLEELLITADIAPKDAMSIIEDFSSTRMDKDVSEDDIKSALKDILSPALSKCEVDFQLPDTDGPVVIMLAGVNGSGKTTTLAKLAHYFQSQGKSVMAAACDTFRTAATDQLKVWMNQLSIPMIEKEGADPASVAYQAYATAVEQKTDILLVDTAGRLQNNPNLMAELKKIHTTLGKQNPEAPHFTWLVLDGTNGQNALIQSDKFSEHVPIDGLIITKLDSSSKAGFLVTLSRQNNVKPVYFITSGEDLKSLNPFSSKNYLNQLID